MVATCVPMAESSSAMSWERVIRRVWCRAENRRRPAKTAACHLVRWMVATWSSQVLAEDYVANLTDR